MTKQDCYNKRKKLGWNVSRHAEDAVSVDILKSVRVHFAPAEIAITYEFLGQRV